MPRFSSNFSQMPRPQPMPQYADPPSKPLPATAVDMAPNPNKKWYWKPSPSGDLNKVIDSLTWLHDELDPQGKKMNRKELEKSYKNFQIWYMEVIKQMIKEHREEENKSLLD